MVPLAPPITTGNCRSFSTDCPVPKHPVRVICCIPKAVPEARLTSLSIITGVVHFIPSARLVDGVSWGLNLVTRTVKGKDKFRTAAPNGRLLRPAGGSLGLFFYRNLDGIIIIIIIITVVVVGVVVMMMIIIIVVIIIIIIIVGLLSLSFHYNSEIRDNKRYET
jgi:hypothetical protein